MILHVASSKTYWKNPVWVFNVKRNCYFFEGAKQKVAWENGRRFSALQGTLWSDDAIAGKNVP